MYKVLKHVNGKLVPSYDGEVWRLHAGEKAEVVWPGSKG